MALVNFYIEIHDSSDQILLEHLLYESGYGFYDATNKGEGYCGCCKTLEDIESILEGK